jgi:hypothetical protein
VLLFLAAMARVHRQMSADSAPFSADQAVSPLSTQLQVSTTQVKYFPLHNCFTFYRFAVIKAFYTVLTKLDV